MASRAARAQPVGAGTDKPLEDLGHGVGVLPTPAANQRRRAERARIEQ